MLAVYDLSCNGLREPRGVVGEPRLSWRLGSSEAGVEQFACQVVVTSMQTADVAWDSGVVCSRHPEVRYAGAPLVPGDQYVWFVTVWDAEGEQAYGAPTAFMCGDGDDDAWSEWPPQRKGMVWTSDAQLNEVVEEASGYQNLAGTLAMPYVWDVGDNESGHLVATNQCAEVVLRAWREWVGLADHSPGFETVRIAPPEECDLQFVQASLLIPQGMLFIRWERIDAAMNLCAMRGSCATRRLQVSIPPGVRGTLLLGDKRVEVASGKHVLFDKDDDKA